MQNLENFKGMNGSEVKGFFTGLILGDGSIDKGVHKRSFTFKSTNKELIEQIKEVVNNNTPFKYYIKETPSYISKDGVNHKTYWEFKIIAHSYFNKIYHNFYNDSRHRKIYSETLNWLTPFGLANWYMSDGYVCLVGKTRSYIIDRRMDICTDRYYLEDIQLITQIFKSKFGLNTSVVKRANFYRIRIKKDSYEKFINLISPYIVPSMKYKLYLGYNNKPDILSKEAWNYQKYLQSAIALTDNAEG